MPGEAGNEPLPVSGTLAIFRLQTGPRPGGRKVQVILGFELPQDKPTLFAPPAVRVNSILCKGTPRVQGTMVTYDVPEKALADEVHAIEVEGEEGKAFKIVWVEIAVAGE